MTYDHLSDDEARGMLARAARAMADMLERVHGAIRAVNQESADAIYASRVAARDREIKALGVRADREDMRQHPLYPLLSLAEKLGRSIERILAITNPQLLVERKLAEARAAKAVKTQAA